LVLKKYARFDQINRVQIHRGGQGRRLMVSGDPLRLSQVLSNLLTNAAKYTDAKGRIALTVE
jgi:signal transduction histidine kinase